MDFEVTVIRFDDEIWDEESKELQQEYRGYRFTIVGDGVKVFAKTYDDECTICVTSGATRWNIKLTRIIRSISKQLFGKRWISWL